MSWPLFVIDDLQEKHRRFEPGACWFIERQGPSGDDRQYFLDHLASDEYKRDWAEKRPPICVCLPGGSWWPIDQQFNGTGGRGWMITGDAPNLTAHPSVNAVGVYHGWLRDGVLTDDCEGRTFS